MTTASNPCSSNNNLGQTHTCFKSRLGLRNIWVVHEDEPTIKLPADLDVLNDIFARELALPAASLRPLADAAVVGAN